MQSLSLPSLPCNVIGSDQHSVNRNDGWHVQDELSSSSVPLFTYHSNLRSHRIPKRQLEDGNSFISLGPWLSEDSPCWPGWNVQTLCEPLICSSWFTAATEPNECYFLLCALRSLRICILMGVVSQRLGMHVCAHTNFLPGKDIAYQNSGVKSASSLTPLWPLPGAGTQ